MKKKLVFLGLTVLFLMGMASAQYAEVDSFEYGSVTDNYQGDTSEFSIGSNTVYSGSNSLEIDQDSRYSIYRKNSQSWVDNDVNISIQKYWDGSNPAQGGIMLVDSSGNGYFYQSDFQGSDNIRIYTVTGGDMDTKLKQVAYSPSNSGWYEMRLIKNGDTYTGKMFYNGNLKDTVSVTDSTYTGQDRYGVMAYAASPDQFYDYIQATDVNSAPSIDSTDLNPSDPDKDDLVSLEMNGSDPEGDPLNAWFDVERDGTLINDSVAMNEPSNKDFKFSDAFRVGQTDVFFNVTFILGDGSTNTTTKKSFYIDDSGPQTSLVEPKNQTYSTSSIDYNLTTQDDQDDVDSENIQVDIKVDGSTQTTQTVTEGDNAAGSLTISDGSHNLTAVATEQNGTSNSQSHTEYFKVDTQPPNVTILNPAEDSTTNSTSDIPLNVTIDEFNLDTSSCEYQVDGGTNISVSNCGNTTFSVSGLGNHSVTYWAKDNAGNYGKDTNNFTADQLNKIRAKDALKGSTIQNFSIKLDNGTATLEDSTSSGEATFFTSNAPRGNNTLKIKSSGYNTKTDFLNITDSFSLDKEYSLDRATFSLQVYDEQTNSELYRPLTALFSNTTNNKEVAWGGQEISGSLDVDDPSASSGTVSEVFDRDKSTSIKGVVSEPSDGGIQAQQEGWVEGYVGLKKGQNRIFIKGDASASDTSLKRVEMEKNGGYTTVYGGGETSTFTSNFTINNSNGEFSGKIKPVFESTPANGETRSWRLHEVWSNRFEDPSFNVTSIPTGDVEITVDDTQAVDNYKPRSYDLTISQFSQTTLRSYLLESGEGIYMNVETVDSLNSKITGVKVSTQRNFNGVWRPVASDKTGGDGSTSFYLDPDVQYRAVATHPNYATFTGTFSPSNYQFDPLIIQMGEDSNLTQTTVWSEVEVDLDPDIKGLNKSDSYTFNWTVNDPESKISEWGIRVKNGTGTTLKTDSITTSPGGGSITLDFNVSNSSTVHGGEDLVVEGFIFRNKNQQTKEYVYEKTYKVRNWIKAGLFSIKKILAQASSGTGSTAKGFIAMLASLMIGTKLKSRFNKAGGGLLTLAVLGIFAATGWFDGFIFILTVLSMVGIYALR